MGSGEMLYLVLVLGSFAAFAFTLAIVSRRH